MTEGDEQELVLHPNRGKIVLFLLGSLVFVAIGLWMVRDGDWRGWLGLGFFGLCAAVFVVQLVPGSSYLKITENDLVFCSLYRVTNVPWASIAEFGTYSLQPGQSFVGFNLKPGAKAPIGGRKLSKALAGYESGLPDSYGMKPAQLAELLNEHLARRA